VNHLDFTTAPAPIEEEDEEDEEEDGEPVEGVELGLTNERDSTSLSTPSSTPTGRFDSPNMIEEDGDGEGDGSMVDFSAFGLLDFVRRGVSVLLLSSCGSSFFRFLNNITSYRIPYAPPMIPYAPYAPYAVCLNSHV
jgi:hypothetical protein